MRGRKFAFWPFGAALLWALPAAAQFMGPPVLQGGLPAFPTGPGTSIKVPNAATTITGTNGLTGGGDLTASRTIGIANGGVTNAMLASGVAAANLGYTPLNAAATALPSSFTTAPGLPYSGLASGAPTATSSVPGLVKPDGTTILNALGVISVSYGTAANTAAQGNDSRITGALQTSSLGTGVVSALGAAVTGAGAIMLSASPVTTGTLTGAAANFSGAVSIGGTPPSTGELNVVGASGGIGLAVSDNVNASFYVRPSTSGILLGTDPGGLMLFATSGNAASNTKMNISSAGNVTIGNGSGTQTTYTFDVLGTGNFTGALSAQSYTGVGSGLTALVAANMPWTQTGTGASAITVDAKLKQTCLSLLDFGADPTDTAASDAAIQAWYAAGIAQKKCLYVPHGKYKTTVQTVFELQSVYGTGITMAGDGKQQSILDASTVTTSPAFQVQVSGGTTSAPASAFYVKILDVGFLGNIAGPVIALGKADISDYLNNIDTNIWVGNQSTSASAIGTQVNGMTGPNVLEIVSNNAGHGDAIQVRAAAFTEFHVSGGSADNAMHFTGSGYIFGNTIVSPDFEVVRHSVLIDAANASYNTFVGGQLAYSVSAISATAGGSGTAGGTNLFINPNFAAASQTLASLTWSGATVTGTTSVPHGFTNGTTVTMVVSGATPTAYNGTYAVTFTGASTFTYSLASNPGTETVPGIVYPQSNAIDANGSAGVTVQTAGGPTAGNAPAVWSLSNIAGTGWQTQVSVAGAATTTNYVASQPMIWNVQTGGSYSWTVNGVQALGLTASGGGVFSGAVTSANFQSTGTNAGYFTADRTGAGQAGLFRAGGINYLFDSTYGTALSWTGSGAISIPGALTVGGALTGATASLTGVVSIGGTPPSTGELNVVGASGGIALALSDNVNSSFYVRTSTSGILLGTDPGGLMLFAAGGNAASNTKMNISSAGNVTIGNGSGTQTTYTFDVLGTGNFTGALTGAAATFSGTVTSSNYQSAGSNSGYFATDRSGTGTAGFFRSGGINYLYDSVYGLALSWNGSGQVAVPGALSVSGGSLTVSNSGSTLFTVTSGGAQINTNLYAPGYQEALATPSSSSAACAAGQFGDDGSYHYVCTATNTWKRVALSSF